jgi:hypothetical protein
LYGVDSGDQAGWFTVGVAPARAAEINRALAGAGIYAAGLEPGSDLESIFLELTGRTGAVAAPPSAAPAVPEAGPPPMAPQQ